MGRGRSKAKETRVARDLKYSNSEMDLEKLAQELHGEIESDKLGTLDNSYEWKEKSRSKE
jgi:hypothetical protein